MRPCNAERGADFENVVREDISRSRGYNPCRQFGQNTKNHRRLRTPLLRPEGKRPIEIEAQQIRPCGLCAGERRPGMKPSGRLGQSGQKHNAVRTKLLCRASEGYFPAYTLFRRISKKSRLLTSGSRYLEGC